MLYHEEELFIEKFIAGLKRKGCDVFPYDVEAFYNGIEKMRVYFDNNRDSFGDLADDISLLFIKNPYQGIYSRFRDAISVRNGSIVSFENPTYDRCIVRLSEEDAEYLFRVNSLEIDARLIEDMIDQFLTAA